MKKIYTGILLVMITLGSASFAQDPHFSQYYANPLYLNPAFAGTALCPRVILNFRDQWPSISGTYVTYNASYDQHIEKISGGIGVLFNTDRAGQGILNTTTASFMYSFRLEVNRTFSMKMAIQATYFQKHLDWQKLTFPDMIDKRHGFVFNTNELPPKRLTKANADFSAGLLGYGEKYFVGFAVHHLTRPDEGFISKSRMPMKFTVHAGGIINLVKKVRRRSNEHSPTLSPNILFMQQQNFQQINYGLYFNRYPFVGGLWFRQNFKNSDAVIFMVGIQANMFKIGYSYDLTISKLTNATGGAHEVSFALQFNCKPPSKRVRAINCPSF
ncbi:MAG TPA: type IX secretion system membrane protein PorP/SprF [Bacteroidales bacterium]|nr:type IX secretion system membrane protein PorP/SprF [Bacteroidales bacterium]